MVDEEPERGVKLRQGSGGRQPRRGRSREKRLRIVQGQGSCCPRVLVAGTLHSLGTPSG